ncbi:hypothetical protein WOLCODRAFT_26876 [Wolfiporia cocos MD-104 SS10]|uniref:F-box domain-containing protein n=1 Tax=Wolfiporia cocos (strain MD-104) TaxID=742152 RepID=A0A2H3K0A1_WOLCO|nr:hypothetical protein WOLCODRAFT_26876 [Wolfiporia cocos MD-104 SS10]
MSAPGDALRFAMTCRAAYNIAMPRVFSEVEFDYSLTRWKLDGLHRIRSFCTFALSHASFCLPSIKKLTIGRNAFSSSSGSDVTWHEFTDLGSAGPLVEVVKGAVNLTSLRIEIAETLFSECTSMVDAVAGLPALQQVVFHQAGPHALAALSRMASRPADVKIWFQLLYDDWGDIIETFTPGEDRFLGNLAEALVDLEFDLGDYCIRQLEPRTVWSNVRRLTLGEGSFSLDVISRAFPNLRELHLNGIAHHVRDDGRAQTWPSLDFVSTHRPFLTTTLVRRLHLKYEIIPHPEILDDDPSLGDTLAMLQRVAPVVVACCPHTELLAGMARSVPSIRFLQLFARSLTVPMEQTIQEVDSWVATTIPGLTSAPLVGLTVLYQAFVRNSHHSCIDHAECANIARKIAGHIRSLQYVGLKISSWDHTVMWSEQTFTWYRVICRAEEGIPEVEQLGQPEGDCIHHKLATIPRVRSQ